MGASGDDFGSLPGNVKEPILLYRGVVTCPICGRKTLELEEYLYEVPYFGRIIIGSGKCSNCGYRYRDVRLAEPTEPKKITLKVKGEKELRYLLVKSAYSYLAIPEKGYEMIPGPAGESFISTVEGILHRFMEALEAACRGRAEEPSCRENREWLSAAIDGKEEFTIVICDYEGASRVFGEGVSESPLDSYCIEKRPEWMESWQAP